MWSHECQVAYDSVINQIVSATPLGHFDVHATTVVTMKDIDCGNRWLSLDHRQRGGTASGVCISRLIACRTQLLGNRARGTGVSLGLREVALLPVRQTVSATNRPPGTAYTFHRARQETPAFTSSPLGRQAATVYVRHAVQVRRKDSWLITCRVCRLTTT